jgi:hypothetical protein
MRKRPWWQWLIGGLVALVVVGALLGDEDKTSTSTVTVTQPASPAAAETVAVAPEEPAEPQETIADARSAADSGDYARAVTIAAAIGPVQRAAIRRRIANRIARSARAAVRAGDRARASRLIARATRFPTTSLTRQARASYRAARARAAQRVAARRLAAEQRRAAAAAKKAAAEAAPDASANCDPNYEGACLDPSSSDYDCEGGSGDGPDYTGAVRSVGSDPFDLDRDGDGVACE